MKWIVEFTANDKIEVEEYSSRELANENFKAGRKLFMNLAKMTADLNVSGNVTEVDNNGNTQVIASFSN